MLSALRSEDSLSTKQVDFLSGDGEMEKLIRTFDWSKTPLGPSEKWSSSFKQAIRLCLTSHFPTVVNAGPALIEIYNDAMIPIRGKKHPGSLGLPAKEVFSESWSTVKPFLEQVLTTGKSTGKENFLLFLDKAGFLEENYFTFSSSPIGLAEGKVEGVYTSIYNRTEQVICERHLQTTKALEVCVGRAQTTIEACDLVLETLKANDADIPFALLYLLDATHQQAALQATAQLEKGAAVSPAIVSLEESTASVWPLAQIIKNKKAEILDVSQLPALPSGRWQKAPNQVILLPLLVSDQPIPLGVLIIGVTPVRALDENYLHFYHSVASQIAVALKKANAREHERLEHKQTGIALARSEQHYKLLTTISPVGIFHINAEGRIVYINQKGGEILGLKAEQAQDHEWLLEICPEDKERVLISWQKAKQAKAEHWKTEYRYLRPDGTQLWVVGEVAAEKNCDNQITGYVGTLTDITELKKMEEARAQQAEDYRKRQDEFVDTMCHELRNPLNGILGNACLLTTSQAATEKQLQEAKAEDLNPVLKAELLKSLAEDKEAVEAIRTCAKHQTIITDDVLNLSKLEAGKVALCEENFDPKKVVKDVVAMLNATITAKKLQIYLKLPYKDSVAKGDPSRLTQVLLNLLSNAIKFTLENGEITLSLCPLEQTADHTVLQFTVEDSGIGLMPEEKAQLFNRFAQANRRTSQEYGGSGLGLAISKNLVELMGGKMTVESEKWKGSKFIFTIACKAAAPEEKQEIRSTQPPPSPSVQRSVTTQKSFTILIVEDNLINQKILKRQLEKEGYYCYIANNGQEAVKMFQQNAINLIFMDVEMPAMNGLEATKVIRVLEKEPQWKHPAVPIIGLSGNARQGQMEDALQVGMNSYLTKPYEPSKLLEQIARFTKAPTPVPLAGLSLQI